MEPDVHSKTVITIDKQRFTRTAPDGTVYHQTLTVKTREETVTRPVPAPHPHPGAAAPVLDQHQRTTTRTQTTRRRQVHRAAPYPGARPVRISSRAERTSTVHESTSVRRRDASEEPEQQEYA